MAIDERASNGSGLEAIDLASGTLASGAGTGSADDARHQPARRAYVAPQLRHLGSVRQLTLGPSGTVSDGGGGSLMTKMSSRDAKEGIVYVDEAERKRLASEVLGLRLATYSYKPGVDPSVPADHRCLGFIIEDAPEAPFVVHQRREVDLYGFASAMLATLQEQQKTIERLELELRELRTKTIA